MCRQARIGAEPEQNRQQVIRKSTAKAVLFLRSFERCRGTYRQFCGLLLCAKAGYSIYMIENGGAKEDDDYRSPLDLLFGALEEEYPNHIVNCTPLVR